MNVWRELGLDRTQDLRAIKRAYAKRLKTTRPDEQPEAFQRLYAAYKAALASASSNQEDLLESSADSVEAPTPNNEQAGFTQQDGQPREMPPEPIAQNLEEQQQLQQYWTQEGERLLNEVKDLLGTAIELHLLERWRFLERSPLILDINFNGQLGVAVFQILTEHQASAKKYYRLGSQVVTYLDTVFAWTRHAPYFYSTFGQRETERIFLLVNEQAEPGCKNMGLRGGKDLILGRQKSTTPPMHQATGEDWGRSKMDIVYLIIVVVIIYRFVATAVG